MIYMANLLTLGSTGILRDAVCRPHHPIWSRVGVVSDW